MGGQGKPLRGGCANEAEEEGEEEAGRDDNAEAKRKQKEETDEKEDEQERHDGEGGGGIRGEEGAGGCGETQRKGRRKGMGAWRSP